MTSSSEHAVCPQERAQREALRRVLHHTLFQAKDPTQQGPTLLKHLETFLKEKGFVWQVHWWEKDRTPFMNHTLDASEREHIQGFIEEWVRTLPLDVTLQYKRGVWSVPALVMFEVFDGLSQADDIVRHPFCATSQAQVTWMTLILNALWQAASPDVKKTWREGEGPSHKGRPLLMTRPWLFWGARLHALVGREGADLPALDLPHALTLPSIELGTLAPYPVKNTKKSIESLLFELWEKDVQLNPALWKTPLLFTLDHFDVLWSPYLSFKSAELPYDLEPSMSQALCALLEKHTETVPFSTLHASCRYLLKRFFKYNEGLKDLQKDKKEPSEYGLNETTDRLFFSQSLFGALERVLGYQPPDVYTAWCASELETVGATTRWRQFWEGRLLEQTLTPQCDMPETSASSLKRQRV